MSKSSRSLFKYISSQQNNVAKHFIKLREKKQYRIDQGSVLIQGKKTINELHSQGIQFKSLIATIRDNVEPQINIPAQKYYTTDINLTRRILGTASKPNVNEIYAEAMIPNYQDFNFKNIKRLLILDHINDPGNLGTLVRTAQAFDWKSGIITSGTCDLFNDKTLRASRGLSLTWPHKIIECDELLELLKANEFTPIVADMAPQFWSPEGYKTPMVGNGLWFSKPIPSFKKIALVLSSEHNGVNQTFKNECRVCLPMNTMVESLNVANAGSIIMYELNRLNFQKHSNVEF